MLVRHDAGTVDAPARAKRIVLARDARHTIHRPRAVLVIDVVDIILDYKC